MAENLLTIVGNVVADPEHKIVGSGVARTRFRVATTQRWRDRASGEWREGAPTYLPVVCWRRLAEHVAASLRRGDPVIVCGRIAGHRYEADGQARYSYELEATSVGHDLARVATTVRPRVPGAGPAATAPGPGAGEALADQPQSPAA